jgi:hypothetical protein
VGCKVLKNTIKEINQNDFDILMNDVFDEELETAA